MPLKDKKNKYFNTLIFTLLKKKNYIILKYVTDQLNIHLMARFGNECRGLIGQDCC